MARYSTTGSEKCGDAPTHCDPFPFSPYPRQHDLAVALREIEPAERTPLMIDQLLNVDMKRRANLGLNKGEVQAPLPMIEGHAESRTRDDKHNGTTCLPAALDTVPGKVIGHKADRHHSKEFLDLPDQIYAGIAAGPAVHLILDTSPRTSQPRSRTG